MEKTKFEVSKETGKHHRLNTLAGEWEGTTKTWFEPGKLADESPMQGTMRPVLDGRFILHEYRGSLSGRPFSGMAFYGYHLESNTWQCAWIDSFHMGTGIMFSDGKGTTKDLSVLGSYGAGNAAERWGWRTELEVVSEDKVSITAYNISPGGEEAKATETVYTRKRS